MKMRAKIFFVLVLGGLLISLQFFPSTRSIIKRGAYFVMKPMMAPLSGLGREMRQTFSFVFNISDLKQKNEELADKLIKIQVDESRIRELEIENSLLKKELGFWQGEKKEELVPAKIIEREPTAFLDYIVVDKGLSDGVRANAPVFNAGVLVGQTTEVFDHSAKITLITSKDSMIQAMLQDSRSKGLLKGGISGLYMDNVVFDAEYREGEYVVTSGLGGKIKEGILIGRARDTQSGSSEIYKTISVDSLVDLATIELVFIQK
jgi:rod shape-determining protein MreC